MTAIVFDLDGTLVDSAPDIMAEANRMLADEGAAPITLAQTHSFIGEGARALVARLIATRDLPEADLPRLHAAFLRIYEGETHSAVTFPGVPEALAALRDAGHALGICTNKPLAPARKLLAHLGLDGFFATVVGGDSLPVMKPDPAPLHAAFAAVGAPLLYVGDSEVDFATARAAGVPFALFPGGYRKGPVSAFTDAHVFEHWSALPGLVASLRD